MACNKNYLTVLELSVLELLTFFFLSLLQGWQPLYATPLYYYNGTTRQVITPVAIAATRSASVASSSPSTPLFREGDSPAGRLMGLPGGIIVQFQTHWNEIQITQWLVVRGLPLGERLGIQGNWYAIPTPAGEIALEIANQLHESGEVVSASPNWWKSIAKR